MKGLSGFLIWIPGAIYLVSDNELFLAATTPPLPNDFSDILRRTIIDDHPHIRKALSTGEPLAIEDASCVMLTPHEEMIVKERNLISILYLPLIVENRPQGILILSTTGQRRIFNEDEIDLYRMLSAQAKLVIENTRLFRDKQNYTIELEQRNKDLGFLTSLAFDLAELQSSENLTGYLIEKLSDYTGAVLIASSAYDPESRTLKINQVRTDKKILDRLIKKLGKASVYKPAPVTDEIYKIMLDEVVGIGYSLHEISFGAIPESIDKVVRLITGFDCYYAITISASGELLGALMLAFKKGQPLPQKDLMISVGHLAAINMRRFRAEWALKLSENKQKAMIANISDVITIVDRNGIITYESPNIERLLGWEYEDLIGKQGFDFIHPDDVKLMRKSFQEVLKSKGSSIFAECRYRTKDGEYKWVRNAAVNLLSNPSINGILLNYHDISERKKAEESLHKFRLGIERSPEAVFITDKDGTFTYANPAFTDIYGYTFEDIQGLTPRILKSGLYPSEIYETYWKNLLSNKPVEGEIINKTKDGRHITIEGVNNPILDKENKIIGFLGIHRDISKRKESEEQLRSSEERFRKAFITSPDAININRLKDGMYVSINDGFTKLTGYDSDETIGKTSAEINIWADISDRKKMVDCLIRDGFVKNLEAKFRMKDGSLRTALMSSSLLDLKGIPHVLSITRDIEEIRRTQDALEESEKRFKQVAENAGEWIWEVDAHGLYKYSSPAVEKLLGYKPEEIINKLHFYDLFSAETRDTIKKEAFKIFEMKEKFYHFKNKNIKKDGSIIVLETSGAPILDSDGNLIGYRGIDSDITERLQFIENLHKLSVAVEQSPASIVITNLEGNIEYVNPRFTQVTGYSFNEAKGKNPRILNSGHTKKELYRELWSRISSGKDWKGEFYNRKKNGELFWEAASISPIIDERGEITHYIAVKEDITDKKEATRKIFDAIIETEERERQRYSHELHDGLGPILSTIRLYFEMLAENTETVHKDLIITRTGNCINEAIQTIKEISYNLSPHVLNNFGIISGIRNFVNRVNETGKLLIDFETNTDRRFDKNVEVALYRIITELINNSVKYSGASNVKLKMDLSENGSYLILRYSDNGCGFDLDEVLKNGKGLGLSNIYQRVSTLNGKINIHTAHGEGVSVLIEIQLS